MGSIVPKYNKFLLLFNTINYQNIIKNPNIENNYKYDSIDNYI